MDTSYLEHHIAQLDYTLSMNTLSLCQVEGMKAENKQRELNGEALAYTEEDFLAVAEENQMTHNDSIIRHRI